MDKIVNDRCTLCESNKGLFPVGIEVVCEDCLGIIQDNEVWLYGEPKVYPGIHKATHRT